MDSKQMNISFLSLGCAKNQVNTEQMMALCESAGYTVTGVVPGKQLAASARQ